MEHTIALPRNTMLRDSTLADVKRNFIRDTESLVEHCVHGSLVLRFRPSSSGTVRTVVDAIEQRPPLRFIRAFPQPDGSALLHLHNISGGVLGGDQLYVSVRIKEGAMAQVTTTGATRVYRHRRDGQDAHQTTRFSIEPGGLLEYLPDPLIPYAGARYRQSTEFHLGQGAGLFAWDVFTPGREARGERFDYEYLAIDNVVTVDGEPILLEHQVIEPGNRSMHAPSALGIYRTHATLLICRAGWPSSGWEKLEQQLRVMADAVNKHNETIWGVSVLVADGILVRGLAREGRHLLDALPRFWQLAKREIYGMEASMPRKIY